MGLAVRGIGARSPTEIQRMSGFCSAETPAKTPDAKHETLVIRDSLY